MKKKFLKRLACVGVAGIMGLSTIGLSGCTVDWQELGANVFVGIIFGPWLLVDAIKGVFSPTEETTERERINKKWDIELPENEILEYSVTSKLAMGEGERYNVFRYEEEPTEFIANFTVGKKKIKNYMTTLIENLLENSDLDSIPEEYTIDWSDEIVWRAPAVNYPNEFYMVYSVDEKRLYVGENIF
jgi:hypothetical protein